MSTRIIKLGSLLVMFNAWVVSTSALAAEPTPNTTQQKSSASDVEQVNVDSIKEKYWARGNETELGVVQNRTYSKAKRVEFGLLGGILFSDPFLSVQTAGASLGYHFNEYFGVQLLGLRHFASSSAALKTFEEAQGATTNTNKPSGYYGLEAAGSVLYGKLSVLGKRIIYYDLHLLGSTGLTVTETGKYFTPAVGIGQRFYLTKLLSLRVDYRLQYYHETFYEKQIITKIGQPAGERDNVSHVITLGISFMFFGD
jgi:outer membrane beta-barrel protein